jgi:hypothetical protein
VEGCELDSSGSGWGIVTGSFEHDNERSGSIKGEIFLNYLSKCYLLKKNSAPWSWLIRAESQKSDSSHSDPCLNDIVKAYNGYEDKQC